MICPRCETDNLVKARVRRNEAVIFLCPECEATWFSQEAIGFSPFVDFVTYMENLGFPPLWTELELLPGQ